MDAVSGTKARILDTRKTAPGLRVLDKYAVRCGGGQNHRLDLSDGVLIKNNHIALAGGIVPALERPIATGEGRSRSKLKCARWRNWNRRSTHGAEAVLLDNMSVEDVARRYCRCAQTGEAGCRWSARAGSCLENIRGLRGDGRGFYFGRGADTFGDAVDMSMRVVPA